MHRIVKQGGGGVHDFGKRRGGAGSYTSGGGYVMWRAPSCESKGPEQGEPAPVGAWGLPQPQYYINKQSFDGNITPNPLYTGVLIYLRTASK